MFTNKIAVGLCALAIFIPVAATRAEPIFLASSYETLYRITPERSIESFTFDVKLRAMHYNAAQNTVYAFTDHGSGDPSVMYRIENAADGTPSLSEYAVLSHQYGTAALIGESLYGFSVGSLYHIDLTDPANPIESYIGNVGVPDTGASGYDPVSNTLYMMAYGTNALYTVDPKTAAATWVGSLGITAEGFGGDWYDGVLYLLAQNTLENRLELGTVDTKSGNYQNMMTILDHAGNYATGLTVIPEPAGLLFLGVLGAMKLIFRRR